MPLSNEDNLRLNVLCAQQVKVIRINESSMLLTAITDRGEARIELRPNSQHEAYLRDVQEFLSEKFLGMPGGFPRHLTRWNRMGMGQLSAQKMLLLGEPEAIIALSCTRQLDAELASYAWWALQSAEIARNLLKSTQVTQSALGIELAHFLLEFLPFEERSLDIVESVKLCLQDQLLSKQDKASLWQRAQRKNPYFVGFLLAGPQSIPIEEVAHPAHTDMCSVLGTELEQNNQYAAYFIHFLSSEGRKWLKSLTMALVKPTDPDVVIALFVAIDHYIQLDLEPESGALKIEVAVAQAAQLCDTTQYEDTEQACKTRYAREQVSAVYRLLNTQQAIQFKAMLVLAQLGENTLNRYFGGRDASGTVMRKHLKPLISQINLTIQNLIDS